jgi:ABC-type nitrate/sulfonate/bicarbonate transport system substrate-binding protein
VAETSTRRVRYLPMRSTVAFVIAALVVASCTSSGTTAPSALPTSAASAPSATTAPLSLSNVSLSGTQEANAMMAFFAAQAKGFYKEQGLTVEFKETTASGADAAAAMAAGAANFAVVPSQATILAITKGANLVPIMGNAYGDTSELAIQQSVADALKLSAASTPEAQIKALKGSHLEVGISNPTSGSYLNLLSVLKAQGIDYSDPNPSSTSASVIFKTLGSPTNLHTAMLTNNVQSIANNPPTTSVPGFKISYGKVSPPADIVGWMVDTQKDFAKAHPDTVQAFVTASAKGWQYLKAHQDEAIALATPYLSAANIPDDTIKVIVPLQMSILFSPKSTPAVTASGWNATLQILNIITQPAITANLSDVVDSSFIKKAMTDLKMTEPQ